MVDEFFIKIIIVIIVNYLESSLLVFAGSFAAGLIEALTGASLTHAVKTKIIAIIFGVVLMYSAIISFRSG